MNLTTIELSAHFFYLVCLFPGPKLYLFSVFLCEDSPTASWGPKSVSSAMTNALTKITTPIPSRGRNQENQKNNEQYVFFVFVFMSLFFIVFVLGFSRFSLVVLW